MGPSSDTGDYTKYGGTRTSKGTIKFPDEASYQAYVADMPDTEE